MRSVRLVITVLAAVAAIHASTAATELPVLRDCSDLVTSTVDIEKKLTTGRCWQGTITDPRDPSVVLTGLSINAGRSKHLYIKLACTSGSSVQVFFGSGTGFAEERSFRCSELAAGERPSVYRFDLAGHPKWSGAVREIRIDIDGAEKDAAVALCGIAWSEKPVETMDGLQLVTTDVSAGKRASNDRMAAWHETIVATDEMRPYSCVDTYVNDRFAYMDTYSLVKLGAGVEVDGAVLWPDRARNVTVEDFVGGVRARYTLGGVRVTTEIVPLMTGRDTKEQEGAALFGVKTDPPTPVVVRCGDSTVSALDKAPRAQWLRKSSFDCDGDRVDVSEGAVLLRSSRVPFVVGIASKGEVAAVATAKGSYASVRLPGGSGTLLVAYAAKAEDARSIAALDPHEARARVDAYYAQLLKCRIETPEKLLNDAFRTALYNLEYNWLKPYGWNECIHHWLALWHMQHTGAAEWIGQADRSRDCNITTAENLLPDGSVPQFMPSGKTRKDFGGSNQFFAWQVRHYWNFTGDRKTIERIAPHLDRVIEQTWAQYDPDHDGLLAWGQQIGNQEDYVSTPFNGTAPSVEGINMLRTAAEFAEALGQKEKAEAYAVRASGIAARLRSELWQRDLGFFAFYRDPFGVVRHDGQYHTLIYPVIWGLLDPLDSWTSIRQLRARMTGEAGETYCSNGFPNHVWGTWGMQAGAAQQPWGAWGLAAVGLRNETYRPLLAAARWAMSPDHRGSWPEVSDEPTACYFSPPAGLYVQSTIEALFGLQVHRPQGYLRVAPSFPDAWPSAKLSLPDYSASYKRAGNVLEYTVTSKTPLARKLRWMLPACRISEVTVNGRAARFAVQPGVNGVTLLAETAPATNATFRVRVEAPGWRIDAPGSVAEGDTLRVKATGCSIEKLDDRCGVLADVKLAASTEVRGRVRAGMLKPYAGFGRIGQLNFSRRTLFLLCRANDQTRFWAPVDITVLPRYECAPRGEIALAGADGQVKFQIRNNAATALKGFATLKLAGQVFRLPVSVAPRSEADFAVGIPRNLLALLSPGDNRATIILPGSHEVDVTLTASRVFDEISMLKDYARARIAHVPLLESELRVDTAWREVREFYAYGHMPWAWSKPPLEAFAGKSEVTVPGLPAVSFAVRDRRLVPVSWKSGRPSLTLDVGSRPCRKLYLLVVPFLDNHDTYAPVGRVDVRTDGGLISRTLSFPGDLDWWCPEEVVGEFSTARKPRGERFGLLPMLQASQRDWELGTPPAFPQPEFWATCLPLKTPTSVMSVIEIDLGRVVPVRSVSITAVGADPAFGVVALTAETAGGRNLLEGTDLMPPPALREPTDVFQFSAEGDLQGWSTEGDAFSVAPVPSLFQVPTLNSLARSGEGATGRAISPEFSIGADDTRLLLEFQGGTSLSANGPGALCVRIIDSASGAVMETLQATGSHMLRDGSIPVHRWRGRKVRLELIDRNTGSSYAWLGVRRVRLTAKN